MGAPYIIKKLDDYTEFKSDIQGGVVPLPDEGGVTELYFGTYQDFPNVGKAGKLYIAKDKKMAYYFDTENLVYVPLKGESSGGSESGGVDTDDCFLQGDTVQCVL